MNENHHVDALQEEKNINISIQMDCMINHKVCSPVPTINHKVCSPVPTINHKVCSPVVENSLSIEPNTYVEGVTVIDKKANNRAKRIARLNKKIDEFVELYADQPKQKSPEWHLWRTTGGPKCVYLGGSEIATATGLNPYQTR